MTTNVCAPMDRYPHEAVFEQLRQQLSTFAATTVHECNKPIQASTKSADLSACERGLVLRFTFAFLFRIPPVVISLCNQGEAPPFDSLPGAGGGIREIETARPEIEPPRTEIEPSRTEIEPPRTEIEPPPVGNVVYFK